MLYRAKDRSELKRALKRVFPFILKWECLEWEHDVFEEVFNSMWNKKLKARYVEINSMVADYEDKDEADEAEASRIAEMGYDMVDCLEDADFPVYLEVRITDGASGPDMFVKSFSERRLSDLDALCTYIKGGLML